MFSQVFQCGEVLRNTTGVFSYKALSSDTKSLFVNCTWVIVAETNQIIDTTLMYLDIPKNKSCAFYSIQVSTSCFFSYNVAH